jgi:single-strand DNA-binding protein
MIAGRLTRDPDRRYTQDGSAVTRFDIAFHRTVRVRGQLTETTGFVTINTWQRLAEVCGAYLHKGSPVVVEGRLSLREWTSSKGEARSRLEIQADNVHFLERKPEGAVEAVTTEPSEAERTPPARKSGRTKQTG